MLKLSLCHLAKNFDQVSSQNLWGEEDSNLRSLRQQIYSLPHLAALESPLYPESEGEPMEGFEPPTS